MSGVDIIQLYENPVPQSKDGNDKYIARSGHMDASGKVIEGYGKTPGRALADLGSVLDLYPTILEKPLD